MMVVEQLKSDIDSANVEEKLKPVLHFVKKLTLTPGQIASKDAQYLFDAGSDEQAFLEAVCFKRYRQLYEPVCNAYRR